MFVTAKTSLHCTVKLTQQSDITGEMRAVIARTSLVRDERRRRHFVAKRNDGFVLRLFVQKSNRVPISVAGSK